MNSQQMLSQSPLRSITEELTKIHLSIYLCLAKLFTKSPFIPKGLPMKYAVAGEHRDFFHKHQLIEFENLLSQERLDECLSTIERILTERLRSNREKTKETSPEKLFLAGRDLWRSDEELKKTILQRSLAETASELVNCKPIRLAYDQLIIPPISSPHSPEQKTPYWQAMKGSYSLEEMSSVQRIACGLMICLRNTESIPEDPATTATHIFPHKAGNGIYFSPTLPIDFSQLCANPNQRFLLIAYAQQTSLYTPNQKDPHVNHLKRFGYHFGDHLSIKDSPFVLR